MQVSSSLGLALLLLSSLISQGRETEFPEDLAQLPPSPGLPDLLTLNDGSRVRNESDWPRRRAELIPPLLHYQYGRVPPRPDRVTARVDRVREHRSGLGTEEWITLVLVVW